MVGTEVSTGQSSKLADRIQDALPGVTPGVCLRAYHGGQLVHDIRVGQTWPIYDLASLTKLIFTQQAMMQAFDSGQWNLDTSVAEVLPDFPNKDVAIRELLTHSSGIEWWKPFYLSVDPALPWQAKRPAAGATSVLCPWQAGRTCCRQSRPSGKPTSAGIATGIPHRSC